VKKGAIQLSLNFLVVIILSLAILTAGILLLKVFIGGAQEIQADLDSETESRMQALLDSGQKVVIPFSRQTITRGDSHLFGVGVLNIRDTTTYSLNVRISEAIKPDDSVYDNDVKLEARNWIDFDNTLFTLNKDERTRVLVLADIPNNAPSGTYIYNVEIKYGEVRYDTIKKIVITVP
jgi:hypothetical protein